MITTILIIIAAAALLYYKTKRDSQRYKRPEYLANLAKASAFLDTIAVIDDYITWVYRDRLKTEYRDVAKFFNNRTNYYKKEEKIKTFNDIFSNFDNYIIERNREYVTTQKQKLSQFFDDIEGKSIDEQQRNAVVVDEFSNLIVAGAGSGKTLTILAKVKYLVEKKGIDPKTILLLSFTNKTVDELNERLEGLGLATRATTFHTLGNGLIKQFRPVAPGVTNENTLTNTIKQYLKSDIYEDSDALSAFIQYVACYMNIPEDIETYESLGEKLDTEKGIDFETLKSKCDELDIVKTKALDTLQGEKVKSVEELTIANFLFLNGIEYEYEKRYPNSAFAYQPDFYLKDYDIWLEHFGVDENDNANWLKPANAIKYVEEMRAKRQTHIDNGTKLLETYSYYNRDKILLTRLTEMLEQEGIKLKPKDPKSLYEQITKNDKGFGDEIIKLVQTFINLSKSRQLDSTSLKNLLLQDKQVRNSFMRERLKLFLAFTLPILEKYDNKLDEENQIDFNDMINQATALIKEHRQNLGYSYIIIDEYQDISFSRFNLIKQIRELCGARLICVGDDWQSIYRFAGSDITLFSNFEKHVGQYEQLFIEQTYRNSQPLIDLSATFVTQNKKQIQKNPKSKKGFVSDPVRIVEYNQNNYKETFVSQIKTLVEAYGNKSILVLGRHSFDIDEIIKISTDGLPRVKYYEKTNKLEVDGFEEVDIKFLTVHKSKGLEADNVVVLQLKNDLFGFPNKMSDDPILSLLLSEDENFRFAEERRLFYVALTRTKNEVILLTPNEKSLFVEELLTDEKYYLRTSDVESTTKNCPYCRTGKLVVRQNSNGHSFLGCSHYPSCNQTYNDIDILQSGLLCPGCESGFMVNREGKFGKFLGCTSYPRCTHKIKL